VVRDLIVSAGHRVVARLNCSGAEADGWEIGIPNSSEVGDRELFRNRYTMDLQKPAVRSMEWVGDFSRLKSTA
jgi:hypothetical protein